MPANHVISLVKQTYREWSEDKGPRLGAAFTRVWTGRHGVRVTPSEPAEPLDSGERAA